jgi:hypothetical protein
MKLPHMLTWPATVLAAVFLWVVFRSPSWTVATKMLTAMTFNAPEAATPVMTDTLSYGPAWAMTAAIGLLTLLAPNSRRLARNLRQGRWFRPIHAGTAPAQPAFLLQALIAGALLYFAIASIGSMQSKFIYFNF